VTAFGGRAAQELAPCWHVEKQFAHGDAGADPATDRSGLDHTRACAADEHAFVRGLVARADVELADRRDAGQSLATETVRSDRFEIVERPQFARGVPLETEQGVRGVHAATIVLDVDLLQATGRDVDVDARRTCIERILDQLFDDAGRALHHLASGDLARQLRGQDVDGHR
jgi:hypothetical protein